MLVEMNLIIDERVKEEHQHERKHESQDLFTEQFNVSIMIIFMHST